MWHEVDEHVTCTLKSRLMQRLEVRVTEELEELPVGNGCMEKQSLNTSPVPPSESSVNYV